jgi:hypothetical protein
MEFIHVTVSLRAALTSRKKYESDFLVDTGAIDSMASGKHLKESRHQAGRPAGARTR